MKQVIDLAESLKKLNFHKSIKVRAKKSDGQTRWSLYLDFISNNKRVTFFPKLYFVGTKEFIKKDKESLDLIVAIRDEKELQLLNSQHGFELKNSKVKVNFITYFENIVLQKTDRPNYNGSLQQFKLFAGNNIQFEQINETFCYKFRKYLLNDAYLIGHFKKSNEKKVINQLTARTYFSIFKIVLNMAVKEKLIKENPAKDLTIKKIPPKRIFLMEEELKLFLGSKTDFTDVKNAFLFSSQTSLRLGDIRELKFSDIIEDYVYIRVKKNDKISNIKLSKLAQNIINEQRNLHIGSNLVFHLSKSKTDIIKKLNSIAKDCGLTKHINFKASRHSFATLAVTRDINIYDISAIMSHSDVSTTQIYAKLLDKKKDQFADAINLELDPSDENNSSN